MKERIFTFPVVDVSDEVGVLGGLEGGEAGEGDVGESGERGEVEGGADGFEFDGFGPGGKEEDMNRVSWSLLGGRQSSYERLRAKKRDARLKAHLNFPGSGHPTFQSLPPSPSPSFHPVAKSKLHPTGSSTIVHA